MTRAEYLKAKALRAERARIDAILRLDWQTATVCRSPQGAPCTFRVVGNQSALVFGQLMDGNAQFLPPARMDRIPDGKGQRGTYRRYVAYYRCPKCRLRNARRTHYGEPDNPIVAQTITPRQLPGGVLAAQDFMCETCFAHFMADREIETPNIESPDYTVGEAWLEQHDPEYIPRT